MDKQFQSKDIEAKLAKSWLDSQVGSPNHLSSQSYCILFPPPNDWQFTYGPWVLGNAIRYSHPLPSYAW